MCLSVNAILISPDYRLIPESNAADIISDVEAFWLWLRNTLPLEASSWHARPDLSLVACAGTSAGGYLAVQSSLLFPHISQIKVILSIAGSLYTDIPHYRVPGPKVILGKRPPPPRKAEMIIREYTRNMKEGVIRTSGDAVEMWEFLTCVLQQAYLPRWLGLKADDKLDVMKMLEKVDSMPPIWLVQGREDSVVCFRIHLFERTLKRDGEMNITNNGEPGPADVRYRVCGSLESGSTRCARTAESRGR